MPEQPQESRLKIAERLKGAAGAKSYRSSIEVRARRRRAAVRYSFLVITIIPLMVISLYMIFIAEDRYASEVSFSIRSEEYRSPIDMLAGLGQISGGVTTDAEILHEYISSQKIVEEMRGKVDLGAAFQAHGWDPVFSLKDGYNIQELRDHWNWQVHSVLDKSSGVVKVEAVSFSAEEARQININVLELSQNLVDRMSRIAREDAMRYAQLDLDIAQERLRLARQKFAEFRAENNVIDPRIDIQNQGGVLSIMQQQLVESLISYEMMKGNSSTDPRLDQALKRIDVIRAQISAEREKSGSGGGNNMVSIVGKYEALALDQQFAEEAYISATAALDSARAEASRRSKYLAVHIEPTLADSGRYPNRLQIISVSAALLTLLWSVVVMIAYAIRDRR